MEPKGGTEILSEALLSRLKSKDLEGINLIPSVCHPSMIKEGHKNIVWQHLSYDQPNVQYMKDRRFVDSVDHFVYVSHWQFNRFRERFAIPEYKSTVIKNAVDDHTGSYGRNHFINTGNDVVRIMYTSTPWRGLSILVRAIEILNNLRDDFECIIYSSTKIYGKQFENIEGDNLRNLLYLQERDAAILTLTAG